MRFHNINWLWWCLILAGCTVKAVGDPDRPITIKAHVTVDIRELKDTAVDIEDFVRGEKSREELPVQEGRPD